MKIDFDDVLGEINNFGLYQKLRYLLICIAALMPAIVTYIHSFTAAVPPHRCKNPYDEDDLYVSSYSNLTSDGLSFQLDRCKIVINGTEEDCKEWVFDKTYYKSTLTEDWNMVCSRALMKNQVQTVYFFGYMVGSIIMGILADKFGRRPIMLSSFILMIIGGIGAAFGPQKSIGVYPSYIIYAASRFLIACGTRGINVTGFVLGMEMVGPSKRTFVGIVIEYFFAIGQLLLVSLAFFFRDWHTLAWVSILPLFFFLSYFFILPESPRWLLSKNKNDEAYEILLEVAKVNKRELKPSTWNNFLESQKLEVTHNKEDLRTLTNHPKLIIICCILFLNWIINNFIFYGVGMKSNDLGVNPYLSFAISATVEILGYVVVHLILDKLGRKLPYFIFLLIAGISCFSIFFIENVTTALVMAMIGKFCASGAYAIIYLFSSELFPTSIRNSCMGACSMMARIGSMTAPLVNGLGTRLNSPGLPFLVFGIAGMIGSITAVILPETLDRPLAQNIFEADQLNILGLSCKSKQFESDEVDEKEMEHLRSHAEKA